MAKKTKITHSSSTSSTEELNPSLFGETPVMPDLVVDNIFKFCDKNTLSTCRLVCKNWCRLSLPGWLESAPQIRLMPTKLRKSNSVVSISTFLQSPIASPPAELSSPFLNGEWRKYKDYSLENFRNRKIQRVQLTAFMERFGGNISNLELKDFYLGNRAIFRNILCSKYTPNLKTLKVPIWYGMHINPPTTTTINKNLTTLSLSITGTGNPREEEQFPFEWFELFSYYSNLQALELRCVRKDEVISVMQAVSKCRLAIKSLLLTIEYDDDHPSPYHDERQLPALDSLESLSFKGNPLKSLDILESFPNMTILTLQTWFDIVDETPEIPIGFSLNHLTTFSCNYYNWTTGDIGLLARFMPNVTKLRIRLTDDTFRAICGHWAQLEELTVLLVMESMLSEEAITGISLVNKKCSRNEDNITKLQGLKSFKMQKFFRSRQSIYPRLTSNCVFFGFLRLPLLRELKLVSPWTSKDVLEVIQTHLPFAELTISKVPSGCSAQPESYRSARMIASSFSVKRMAYDRNRNQ